VLDLANFVVVARPGYDIPLGERLPALASRLATAAGPGETTPRIITVNAATPDVSSTEIRRRLRAHESIGGMVAPAVEQHIRRHRLYCDEQTSTRVHTAADHLHGQN
jgi:nicotinic acid mononucleotide adenylyltransferase